MTKAEIEQERINKLMANVPGVVWEAYGNPDASMQRIDFVSDYVEKMLGYPTSQWLKTPNFWLTIVHPDDRERAAQEAANIYKSGESGVSRFRWIKQNGDEIWVEAQSTVIKDLNGTVIGMRGVTMDITERMRIEEKKDEFISIASHELKTPLTSVKGYLQILSRRIENIDDAKIKQLVDKSNQYINKLNDLIADLLDVSRIQAGKLQLLKTKFDIYDLVSDVVQSIEPTVDTHRLIIGSKLHRVIYADKERLEQVLTNLITNAVKYSPQANKIEVEIEEDVTAVTIRVRDYGMGIAAQDFENIFQRFYRAENVSKHVSGLGIGLYLSSEIMKRHGGYISVESKPKKGSTFSFTIPA